MYICRNPKYASENHEYIDLIWDHPTQGEIPFNAYKHDSEEHGKEIYELAVAGEFGEISPYVAPPPPEPEYIAQISALEFRQRFTTEEQLAIKQASYTDAEVGVIYDDMLAAQYIDLLDERVANGLTVYVMKGLITDDRKREVLEPTRLA